MSAAWARARLGEVLTRSDETVLLRPDSEYREITVRLWGRGVVLRGVVTGSGVAALRRFVAHAGQFILSRIDARNGAIGIVPDALDGAIVTNDFPLFKIDEARLRPAFLGWMSRTAGFIEMCQRASEGTTNRVRLQEDKFLALQIPLPSLAQQQRIVARIEDFAAKIKEATGLRKEAAEEAKALVPAIHGAEFTRLATSHPVEPLRAVVSHVVDGPHQTPRYLPQPVDGVPFVTVKNMVTGHLDFSDVNYISREDHKLFSRRCKAEAGDVLYSKDGATRGRPCFIDSDREFSFFVSVALIKPLRDRLDGRYLTHLLNSNYIGDRVIQKSRGDMIPHIVLREIREFPVPLPPLPHQRRMVEELDALQAQVDTLKRLQAETAAEMDALLPSILDKAFKGEL